jgi:hypothetical protein
MIPKILKYNNRVYKLIKTYTNIALYEDTKTEVKESFTKFQLGLVKEKVKPEREANKGGIIKH